MDNVTSDELTEQSEHAQLFSYREAATFLGLPVGTLYALVHARRVPHVRMGARLVRFARAELERWLKEHTVEVLQPRDGGSRV